MCSFFNPDICVSVAGIGVNVSGRIKAYRITGSFIYGLAVNLYGIAALRKLNLYSVVIFSKGFAYYCLAVSYEGFLCFVEQTLRLPPVTFIDLQ